MALTAICSDVRLGLRLMRRSPRFFGLLLAIVVLGIGATTAMFSIVQSLLWQPLPFVEPQRLVMLWGTRAAGDRFPVSLGEYQDWKAESRTLEHVSVAHSWLFSLAPRGQLPQGVVGAQVSGSFFPMLGVQPQLGRWLGPEDDQPGAPRAVVLGAGVWRERFGSDPQLIGQSVLLDARFYTVVGIAPAGFDFSFPANEPVEVWTALSTLPSIDWYKSERNVREWHAMARLRPGITLPTAQAELSEIAARAAPGNAERIGVSILDLREAVVGDQRGSLWLHSAAVALVFLVVCSNVSSLLLVRAQSRRSEFAVRAALGAGRGRLVRQLLTETLLVFLLAAPFSALTAGWLVELFQQVGLDRGRPLPGREFGVDGEAWAFCFGLCVGAGTLAGLLPALDGSRVDLFSVLQAGGTGASPRAAARGVRGALVVAQIALAFVLLTGSGLALSALDRLWHTPAGFEPRGLMQARLIGIPDAYVGQQRTELAARLMSRIAARSGVHAVASNEALPLSGYDAQLAFTIEGHGGRQALPLAARNVVTPGYLDTMKIPLLVGRGFVDSDDASTPPVALISQRLAELYFSGQNPIGKRISHPSHDGDGYREIVGVVGDLRRRGLGNLPIAETYTPLSQSTAGTGVIVARADDVDALIADLPAIVAAIEPRMGVWTRRVEDRVRSTIGTPVRISILLGVFAAVAFGLATLGQYAVVSYTTARRTRELGIRTALGAPPARVLWLVMQGGLWRLGLGGAIGIPCALWLGRVLSARIPQAQGFEPLVYGCVTLALGLAGALATFVPAQRAVRVSPAAALRYE